MKTRMQRAYGVAAEPSDDKISADEKAAPQAKQEAKHGKGDPYPALPRRSLIRNKRPDEL